jgi:hypothetical protein
MLARLVEGSAGAFDESVRVAPVFDTLVMSTVLSHEH